MSQINKVIAIAPPDLMLSPAKEEIISKGYECPYCKGQGFFRHEDERGEWVKADCPLCLGKKELDAIITIEWVNKK